MLHQRILRGVCAPRQHVSMTPPVAPQRTVETNGLTRAQTRQRLAARPSEGLSDIDSYSRCAISERVASESGCIIH